MSADQPDSLCIVETTQETFERDVFERSRLAPVVVDFWAAWCQPCRMLAPLLEQAVKERGGKIVLVKAETDHNPRAAAEFGVQSIPAVYGVCRGEVVDFFNGLLPPEQLGKWLDRLLLWDLSKQAVELEATDIAAAEAAYRCILQQSPQDVPALIGLARVRLAQDQPEESRQIIEQLASRGFLEPEAQRVSAAIELRGKRTLDLDACRDAVERKPHDLSLSLKLAQALASREAYQDALDICLDLVRADRKGVGESGRQLMIDIFRVLPDDSEIVGVYRRKLSSALY